jgi:cystathionine beta-lyase
MAPFDFDRIVKREGTDSYKWDGMDRIYGRKDLIPMWVADMDFPAPASVLDALKKRVEHGIYGYSVRSSTYNSAIRNWLKTRHGWEVDESWIVHAPGVVPAMALAVNTFTEPGDPVLLQSPVYPPFFDIVRKNGRNVVNCPLVYSHDGYRIDFDEVERKLKNGVKLFLLCNPHNPVGRAWKRAELEQLSALCSRYGTIVISDEIHGDWVFEPNRHIPWATVSEEAAMNSVICMAPSKTFNLAGLHTAFLVIPNRNLRLSMENAIHRFALHSQNALSLVAAEAAYESGGEWLDALKHYVRGNMHEILKVFQQDGRVHATLPEATYLMWLDFRQTGLEGARLRRWMVEEARVGMNEGRTFGEGGEGFLRLNAASPRPLVHQALNRIEAALKRLKS